MDTATPGPAIDPLTLRDAFSHFPSGVAAIAASVDGEKHVVVASSFTVGVSLAPPLVAFFVQKTSSTWPLMARAERIGVSILSTAHARQGRQLAARDKSARFAGIETSTTESGAVHIDGAAAWFECSVFGVHKAGDHNMVLLLIHDLKVEKAAAPLVFHGSRFTRLAEVPAPAAMASA